jgi:hypothetical protein
MLASLLYVGKCVPRWIKERSVGQTVLFVCVYTGKCVPNADYESLKKCLEVADTIESL